MSLSEKFQMTVPFKETESEPWVSGQSARINTGNTPPGEGSQFNVMPVGYDATCSRDNFQEGFGGDTDASEDVEPSSMLKGYQRRPMGPTDDLYTGEHIDLFYGEVKDEKGNVGFAERNNYLDRL